MVLRWALKPAALSIGAVTLVASVGAVIFSYISGAHPPGSELIGAMALLVLYAITSAAYYALVAPLFHVPWGLTLPLWLWQAMQYGVAPLLVGLLLAYGHQNGWLYKFGDRIGLNFTHHIASAWDYTLSRITESTFVLVTLDDGAVVAGKTGRGSFASSAREERDIYISEVWEVPESDAWKPANPPRSILLCGKDIRHIEFF